MGQALPKYKDLDTDLADYIETLEDENPLALEFFLNLIHKGYSNEEAYRETIAEFEE
jgi:hypothetical protein